MPDGEASPDIRAWRSEAASQTSKAGLQFGYILDQLSEGHLLIAAAEFVGHINPAAAKTLGVSIADTLGRQIRDLVPGGLSCAEMAPGQPIEVVYDHPQNGRRVLEIVCCPILLPDGGLLWYDLLLHDITDRKATEEALRIRAFTLDQLGDAVVVLNDDGRFVDCNRRICELLGYSRDEILSMDVISLFNPAKTNNLQLDMMATNVREQGRYTGEVECRTKDGRSVIMEFSSTAIHDQDGRPIGRVSVSHDITERKAIEEALRIRSFTLDQLGDAVVVIDEEGRYVDCNQRICDLLGYSRDEILSMDVKSLFDPAKISNLQLDALANNVMDQGRYTGEIECQAKDGRSLILEFTSARLNDQSGQPIGRVTVSHDITERRQLEESLRVRSFMLDQMQDSIIRIDLEGIIRDCNHGAERILRKPRSEILGRHILDTVHPEDIRITHSSLADPNDRNSGPYGGEITLRRDDGSIAILELFSQPLLDAVGQTIGRVSVVRDITERKKMEDELAARELELRTILEHIPAGIFRYDREGRVRYANSTGLRMMKAEDVDPKGLYLQDVGGNMASAAAADATVQYVMDSGMLFFENNQRVENDDAVSYFDVKYLPERDSQGNITGVLSLAMNVTAATETRMNLLAAKEEAELANRSKSEFLANMSHELRTPLNAIIGFSDVLSARLYGELNEKQAEYCKDINDAGHHLLSIIGEILDMSKIEAGRFELQENDIDLKNVLHTCLSIVELRAKEKDIAISLDLPADPPGLFADERCVKQVVLNLLSNSVKFTRPGGRIDIRCELNAQKDLLLTVSDNGVGISAEAMPRLFEPFQQGDASTSRQFGGTGLGLSISRRMMMMHGGDISLTSVEGEGATATVRFPASRVF